MLSLVRSRTRHQILAALTCFALAMPVTEIFAQESKTSSSAQKKSSSKSSAQKSSAKPSASKSKSSAKSSTKQSTKSTSTKKAPSKAKKSAKTAVIPAAAASGAAVAASASAKGGLYSHAIYVQDLSSNRVLYSRNDDEVRPIASISKLMTAIVIVDARLPMDEVITITQDDVDRVKFSSSRLAVGTKLSRQDLLLLSLMSSENRAAHALGRTYPGGMGAFVREMNLKSKSLGMTHTRFVEPTGLSSENVSTPKDLVKLLQASAQRPTIRQYTTSDEHEVRRGKGSPTLFRNTNALVRKPEWDIKVSKTGYISEAGQCLVMVARINNRDTAIVLLDSGGKSARIGDATRIRQMVQQRSEAIATSQPQKVAAL